MTGLLTISPGAAIGFLLFELEPPQWLATAFIVLVLLGWLPIFVLALRRMDRHDEAFASKIVLSQAETDLFEKWKESGDLAKLVKGLTENQIERLVLTTRKVYGTYVAGTGILPNGKTWEQKLPSIGFKVLAAGYHDGAVRFDAILYRRDLASADRIRRPWRQAPERNSAIQLMRTYRTVELPYWMT